MNAIAIVDTIVSVVGDLIPLITRAMVAKKEEEAAIILELEKKLAEGRITVAKLRDRLATSDVEFLNQLNALAKAMGSTEDSKKNT